MTCGFEQEQEQQQQEACKAVPKPSLNGRQAGRQQAGWLAGLISQFGVFGCCLPSIDVYGPFFGLATYKQSNNNNNNNNRTTIRSRVLRKLGLTTQPQVEAECYANSA